MNKEKRDWLNLIDQLEDSDLSLIEEYIEQLEEKEDNYIMQLIHKHDLQDKFLQSLEDNIKKVKRIATKHEEKHLKNSKEDPDKILNKLNKI